MSNAEDRGAIEVGARRLRVVVGVLIVLIAASVLLAWAGAVAGRVHVEIRQHADFVDPRLAATISTGLVEVALFKLWQMLGLVQAGELFSRRVVARFRSFAFWLLLMAAFGVAFPLLSNAESVSNAAGAHQATFVISLTDLLLLGVTALLFLLARVLERARMVDEENREFV